MNYLWTILWLAAGPPLDVSVETVHGPPRSGVLVELNERQLVVEIEGQRQSFDPRDLLALTIPRDAPPTPLPSTEWIELVDGSRLACAGFRVDNRLATLTFGDRETTLETRQILSVRFQPPDAARDDQWREIIDGESRADLLVVTRPSTTSLDQLEGILHDVSADVVEFEYEEQRLSVRRDKLEGIRYLHPSRRSLPETRCQVVELNGSVWQAQTLEWQDDQLRLTTTGGVGCAIPVTQLARLDFSSGNMVYLSDLEYELVECLPFIETQLPAQRILQLYQPRRDMGFEGSGLWLGEGSDAQQYDKGLAVHSRSRLVYRLPDQARKLTALVGIDSRLQGRGSVEFVVRGDNRELLRRTVSGRDPPWPLELDLAGIRRLEILVDFGDALDVADHLNLCNARILK